MWGRQKCIWNVALTSIMSEHSYNVYFICHAMIIIIIMISFFSFSLSVLCISACMDDVSRLLFVTMRLISSSFTYRAMQTWSNDHAHNIPAICRGYTIVCDMNFMKRCQNVMIMVIMKKKEHERIYLYILRLYDIRCGDTTS